MRTEYTDTERVNALAILTANAGNVSRTAQALAIPRTTLIGWRDEARDAALSDRADTKEPTDWASIYGQVALLGAEIIQENLNRYRGMPLTPPQLKDVAVVVGIAADKHLDYRDGRKGTNIHVGDDNRQMVVVAEGRLTERVKTHE